MLILLPGAINLRQVRPQEGNVRSIGKDILGTIIQERWTACCDAFLGGRTPSPPGTLRSFYCETCEHLRPTCWPNGNAITSLSINLIGAVHASAASRPLPAYELDSRFSLIAYLTTYFYLARPDAKVSSVMGSGSWMLRFLYSSLPLVLVRMSIVTNSLVRPQARHLNSPTLDNASSTDRTARWYLTRPPVSMMCILFPFGYSLV